MGRTLGLIADRVDAASHECEVAANEVISPGLRRLVLRSPELVGLTTDPCDVTAFRVSRTDFRHYTPALLDETSDGSAEVTIVVQRHGDGVADDVPTPGHDLVEALTADDDVRLCQWSSTRAFHWTTEERPVLLLGDATVISLALAMDRRARAEGRDLMTVLEVPAPDVGAVRGLLPEAVVVAAGDEPGSATDAWLAVNLVALRALGRQGAVEPVAHLAGHGPSIQRHRAFLREHVGLDRRSIRTQPYWAPDKAGL
ncbi:hypothetical protein GCM10009821_17710 [Aeromicrobium halocynthiae]|uniref:Siderophore-interacting protein n=1 Tax=Aeromicrobium halocynthiae TaxID=560557 RepID=A0ABN2VZJ4_9ACTN